jgi:hypothetical protein
LNTKISFNSLSERRIPMIEHIREPDEPTGGGFTEEEGQGKSLRERAGKAAHRVTEEIREESSKRAKGFLRDQKENLAEELDKASEVFHESSRSFQEKDQFTVARYVDQVAKQADRYSRYLRDSNLDELAEEIKEVARNKPVLFLLSAFTTGVAMSRFLKSSGSREPAAGRGSGRSFNIDPYVGTGDRSDPGSRGSVPLERDEGGEAGNP